MQIEEYLWMIYGAFFLASIVFSILINFIFLRFAQNLGIRGGFDTHSRWSTVQKPAFGGISFYIIFLLSFTTFTTFFSSIENMPNTSMIGLVFATALSFLMGLADDAFNTRPALKLTVQILSAMILIYTGTSIQLFESNSLNYALTILWVVGMMNSINMLDNMDGITSLTAIIAIVSTLIMLYLTGNYFTIYFFTLIGVLASLIGFLFFNWSPSKLFMGDTGSQFLGLFLAFIGIKYFWNIEGLLLANPIFDKFIIIFAFFAVPLIDTLTVTINRILRRQSPMVGGKDHTTHTLAYLGLSDKQVALFFAFMSVLFSGITIYHISVKKGIDAMSELLILCLFLALFSTLLYLNRILVKSTL
jgi:UDP-GlcNAc:undecaprenyl-phosphate GlcNAc-1-phosphate transferase